MKPNVFKKWWSYISEVHIESTSSEYNESLHVLLKNGRYQLCTPNAVYSYADKYDNFKDCFKQLNLNHKSLQNILLLGFGLGSIPYMLEKKFHKDFSIKHAMIHYIQNWYFLYVLQIYNSTTF